MAAGTTDFPTSLDTTTNLPIASALAGTELDGDGNANKVHTNVHGVTNTALVQIETKMGTGSGAPSANKVLRATGTGTSAWGQAVLTTDVSGTLPVGNGGTGATSLTSNALITGNGSSAVQAETNLTFSTNVLQIGADGDIEPRLDLLNDENSAQIGIANATDDMVTGSADGDLVINSVGDHNVIFAQNDTKAVTIDTDGDVTFANNIDGGTWNGGTITVAKGGTGATSLTDKAVLISQDSGTDTVGSVALTSSGQIIIGGSSGPAAATLTAGSGVTITNGDGSISIAASGGVSAGQAIAFALVF